LLDRGVPYLATVGRAGFADHANLTCSLRRFVGQPRRAILASKPATRFFA
jgi:hypothetical protein